jgi:hypothetical protein
MSQSLAPPAAAPVSKFLLTMWQLKWASVQFGVLLVMVAFLLGTSYSSTTLLFTTSMGQKMAAGSLTNLALGLGAGLAVCLALDLALPGWEQRHKRAAIALRWLLGGAQLLLFLLPAVYVGLIGPSVIRISQHLTMP